MEVVKNIVLNWILPLAAVIAVYAVIQASRAPDVAVDEAGNAPVFTLVDLDGAPVSLAQFRGRAVLVNFWATWCGPCRQEIPELNRFHAANPDVPLLAVAVDSGDLDTLRDAAREMGIEFRVLRGTGAVKKAYDVRTIPTTFLVDANGVLAEHHVGVVSGRKLRGWLARSGG